MLISKSFIVTGDTTTRDGLPSKDIGSKVDKALNSYLAENEGDLVDLQVNAQINSSGQDVVFLTIVLKVDGRKAKDK